MATQAQIDVVVSGARNLLLSTTDFPVPMKLRLEVIVALAQKVYLLEMEKIGAVALLEKGHDFYNVCPASAYQEPEQPCSNLSYRDRPLCWEHQRREWMKAVKDRQEKERTSSK